MFFLKFNSVKNGRDGLLALAKKGTIESHDGHRGNKIKFLRMSSTTS